MEGAVYADLMFQSHEVRDQETLRMDDRENMKEDMSCTSEKNLGSPFLRRLLVGSLLLVVALFTLTVTLLSYSMLCPFCPPGWTLFETSCYLHSAEDARSWGESLPWCRVQGGHLVVINDEEEQNFLESLVNDTIWIGLSDYHREGNWRWVDGTPYDSTTWSWHTDQPNNDGDEDCVTLSRVSKWNDDKCSEKYKSVCERRADRLTLKGGTLSN
ncbi:C-type lectin domain family 4 member M-like isoform X3 [Hyla sarda]|uniref:C-type lectin domain family 4 member M-like isoform X3 n=1 Tax=Hyla sarda TaxID=327740 RepID=UPI0024C306FB|nr:C-type lectin domain family 4 member M-like isoform X3 [Hyla sarda]